jgi:RHS repeat-associated protein
MVTTTKYVWDPVFDCVTHELDENNAVKAVYHNEPQQYGGVLSQRRGNTSHYHHHDALGSTRFLTDSTGNVTDTYLNDAWGNSVASTGTTVNPFKWIGKYGYYTDNSTGQVYVRARMYQPTMARWYSEDPLLAVIGLNYYCYSLRGMVTIDPSGKVPCDTISGGIHSRPDAGGAKVWFEGTSGKGNGEELGKWQSIFNLSWTADPEQFKGSGCCECCCNWAGIVQIFRTTAVGFTPLHHRWPLGTWTPEFALDGGIPYPHGGQLDLRKLGKNKPTAGNPCSTPPLSIAMFDSPGIWPGPAPFTLRSYKQEFETCIVCLNGCEGPIWDFVYEFPGSITPYNDRLVSYGCVTWEHSFTRGNGEQVIVNRKFNGRELGTIDLEKDQKAPTWYTVSLGKNGEKPVLKRPTSNFLGIFGGLKHHFVHGAPGYPD